MSTLWLSSFSLHEYTAATASSSPSSSSSSWSSSSKLTSKPRSFDLRCAYSIRPLRYAFPPKRKRPIPVFCSVDRPEGIPSSSSSSSPGEEVSASADRNSNLDASSSLSSSSDKVFVNDIKFLQEISARLKDPFHHIFLTASKRIKEYIDRHLKPQPEQQREEEKGRKTEEDSGLHDMPMIAKEEEWDWERWKKHFDHLEEQESLASILKFKLEDAIDDEDFQEAARLKGVISKTNGDDPVCVVLTELKKAVSDEDYEQATKLRDEAAAGMIGWWIGIAEGENDPYGRIINISSAYGRYIAKSYSARQLITAFPGASLFEVFVRKDSEGYHQQAVYLQRGLADPRNGTETSIHVNIVDVSASNDSGKRKDLIEAFGDEKENEEDATVSSEKLRSIISFLKERIPDVKLKVYRVIKQNGEDIPKILEQIFEEVEMEGQGGIKGSTSEVSTEDAFQEIQQKVGESGETKKMSARQLPKKLVSQNVIGEKLPQKPTRVPAKIEFRNRDSFLFHIDDIEKTEQVATEVKQAPVDVVSEASETVSDGQKISVKVSKDLEELLKLAVNQVQRQRGLSKRTLFHRIDLTNSSTDSLTGLYIGAFGPYTSELVQLKRKYGNWHEETDEINSERRMEFVEYVEAVKLTGDMNVPAGQVTFRAKIGKDNKLPHRGLFPEELGLIARYKGQGRLAEPGFKNPQWVDGELLLFDGKGFGSLNGAELGFVYSVPEKNFLVLFNRIKLEA